MSGRTETMPTTTDTITTADGACRVPVATPDGAGIRAVIAGDGEEREPLLRLIGSLDLEDRVVLAGPLDDDQLVDHLAKCRAVCFPPLQEDYGFVTAEAFASSKPVVTCHDSGGPAELTRELQDRYLGV